MKIDPNHLEILAAIVDQGGLTEGAKAINKSQPSVSRSIAALEDRLGIALFEANRRPLQPTPFGLQLAEEGRKIRAAGQAVSALIEHQKTGRSGAIRLAGTPIFMDGVVAPIVANFQAKFPEIQIQQSYGYLSDLVARLQSGSLDIAIVPTRANEVPQDLSAFQISPGKNVIACRVGHPLARAQTIKLSEIAKFPWIAPPPESPLYHDLRAALNRVGVTNFRVSFSGGSLASVTSFLTTSDSLTVLPRLVVDVLARQNALAALPIRIGDPDRHLQILTAKGAKTHSAPGRLADYLRTHFLGPGGRN